MTANAKPVPTPDSESKPFWDAAARHQLVIQECTGCGKRRYPPTTYCPFCRSDGKQWINATGNGKVFSWVVVHHPVPREAYAGDVPYVVALVELEEGVRIVSNIVSIKPSDVQADMKVRVRFDDVEPGITLPRFVPA